MSKNIFFIASKFFQSTLNPSMLLLYLIVVSALLLWTRYRRFARALLSGCVALLLLAMILPLDKFFLAPLASRFPEPGRLPEKVGGIVVLGGSFNLILSEQFGYPVLSNSGHRLFAALSLREHYPDALIFFSGFSGRLGHQGMSEADVAALFFKQHGLTDGIIYEGRARNTYENAIYTRALANPQAGENWLLITSDVHMPRAVGVFRKASWETIPFPVANAERTPAIRWFSWQQLNWNSAATREWLGLLAYFVTGKTDALFPAPG